METLPNFCENMDPDKWDTIVWYRVTQDPQEFRKLTGCQRDPRVLGRHKDFSYFGLFSILGAIWLSFNALRGCLALFALRGCLAN